MPIAPPNLPGPEWLTQKLEPIPVEQLRPHPANARSHPERQIKKLMASMRTFGFVGAVIVDAHNTIISGHACVEAAQRLAMKQVPCVRIAHLSEEQARALLITLNRLAELSDWNQPALAAEFKFLADAGLDFSLDVTGFEAAEIDFIIEQHAEEPISDPDDDLPDVNPEVPAVTQPGDLWRLGSHRILCGDARDRACYEALLGQDRAQMIFTDPPYNVPINGHVSGLGKVRHREFAIAAGEMSSAGFTAFLKAAFQNLVEFSESGSIHDICIDWKHIGEMIAAGADVYSELKNICVWCKSNSGMGSLYRAQHEFVCVWKSGTAPHINNVELGRFGRNRTNLWRYPGLNSFGRGRDAELAMHPTVKPVALVADAIRDCSKRGGIILDPFAGSGTTIIAAERTGRRAAAMEIDPAYVDTAIGRWQGVTGQSAIHIKSGRSFTELEERRQNGQAGLDDAGGTGSA